MAELDSSPRSIQSLYALFAEGKLWVNRRYQRKLVWTLEEKQKLVESVLRKYPIPAILLAERDTGDYEVIDGLQRLHSLMSFIETAFPTERGRAFDVAQFPTANTRAAAEVFTISEDHPDKLTALEVGTRSSHGSIRTGTSSAIRSVGRLVFRTGSRLWCGNSPATSAETSRAMSSSSLICRRSASTCRWPSTGTRWPPATSSGSTKVSSGQPTSATPWTSNASQTSRRR
jgi:hypothetical protein